MATTTGPTFEHDSKVEEGDEEEREAVTERFPSSRPLLRAHFHRSTQHQVARSHRCPRRAHTSLQA